MPWNVDDSATQPPPQIPISQKNSPASTPSFDGLFIREPSIALRPFDGLGMIASQLQVGGIPFVILDQSTDRAAEAREAGWLTLQGEATDEALLRSAGIVRARVLATVLPNDAAK